MLQKFKVINDSNYSYDVDLLSICPFCDRGIEPKVLFSQAHTTKDNENLFFISLLCPVCEHSWVNEYKVDYTPGYVPEITLRTPYKHLQKPEEITKDIANLSPVGARIYAQSLQAESEGFDTLVGIGLRKSLEFFIKDFLSLRHPDEEEEIRKTWLSNVIKTYIKDDTLKQLATATAYIGNDETHYTRTHTTRDLQDLKKFLSATLRYIEYQLTILDVQEFLANANSQ
ncbi:TPA: hypothetical protein ACGO6U_000457 [Streptococcus suis]